MSKKRKRINLLIDFLVWHENNRQRRKHIIIFDIVDEYIELLKNKKK
jgi:hypothetical protein